MEKGMLYMNTIEKIANVKENLSARFIEREDVIEGLFVSLIAGQHTLLIGPPGTGKSEIVTEFSKHIGECSYFQWLLTQFTTPDELFGPVSLDALEKGVYKRNTDQKLPKAHISFLDEIFKSNSAILNALLTLINERIYYNNGGIEQSPLLSLIGASNEYPEEEGLEALFDRFMMRYEVGYIKEEQRFLDLIAGKRPQPINMTITVDEIQEAQNFASMVLLPDDVTSMIGEIRQELKEDGIILSDRRFVKAIDILKAKAYLDGRMEINTTDLSILTKILWEEPDQQDTVASIIDNYSLNVDEEVDALIQNAEQVWNHLQQDMEDHDLSNAEVTDFVIEAQRKLKEVRKEILDLEKKFPANNKVKTAISKVDQGMDQLKKNVFA